MLCENALMLRYNGTFHFLSAHPLSRARFQQQSFLLLAPLKIASEGSEILSASLKKYPDRGCDRDSLPQDGGGGGGSEHTWSVAM